MYNKILTIGKINSNKNIFKNIWPRWPRVGYGMSNEKIIEKIHKPREPFNVNIIAQIAAAAALDDLAHIEKSQQVNSAGMFFLKTELKKMGLNTFPSYANFILIDFGIPARVIYEELLKKGRKILL